VKRARGGAPIPPRLGEHTRAVLAGLGVTVAEIDAAVAGT
jgi:hypothetical protein